MILFVLLFKKLQCLPFEVRVKSKLLVIWYRVIFYHFPPLFIHFIFSDLLDTFQNNTHGQSLCTSWFLVEMLSQISTWSSTKFPEDSSLNVLIKIGLTYLFLPLNMICFLFPFFVSQHVIGQRSQFSWLGGL